MTGSSWPCVLDRFSPEVYGESCQRKHIKSNRFIHNPRPSLHWSDSSLVYNVVIQSVIIKRYILYSVSQINESIFGAIRWPNFEIHTERIDFSRSPRYRAQESCHSGTSSAPLQVEEEEIENCTLRPFSCQYRIALV